MPATPIGNLKRETSPYPEGGAVKGVSEPGASRLVAQVEVECIATLIRVFIDVLLSTIMPAGRRRKAQ